ncbi:proline-specific peptidase [Annulohypoxylon truncatum]|uniref:proline-specific peptidase n=1 Tax=Annulohypoxylon truncatum TaxID=327061 RepID=UPI002008E23A|nr:proline-specific peptidase [Annulohypoxylon truncatum]KAI1207011.1 proline-specific peptidase [Annulohypoxylon truncatum]
MSLISDVIIGDLNESGKTPLIILHGGPGLGHDYLLPLNDLAPEIPLVFYDQIGSGRSTHLPDRSGNEKFWCMDLFIRELDNLLACLKLQERPIDVYGHSWGGILAASWASRPSPSTNKLRHLVLSSSPASMSGFRADLATLRKQLPEEVQAVLNRADETKDFTSSAYQAAVGVFYQRHLSLTRLWRPREVQDMQNVVTGSLRDWTCIPSLHKIKVPTLLLDGSEDTVQNESVGPLFEHIEKVKRITLDNAGHFAHVDQREKYMKHLRTLTS